MNKPMCAYRTMLLVTCLVMIAMSSRAENACIDCHKELEESNLRKPAEMMSSDVHSIGGLTCVDCHGGDASAIDDVGAAHDESAGFLGKPKTSDIPDFCARCHSNAEYMRNFNPRLRIDQELEYRTSHHGKLLAKGDTKVATCISCHGVHGIKSISDARSSVYPTKVPETCAACHANKSYMAEYGIPTDQFALFKASVHGMRLLEEGDISAPACNDCHGNHGAAPPGVSSVAFACGECHANNRDFFNNSPHHDAFAELELGQCTTCHNHHAIDHPTDEMLGVGDDAMCVQCHSEGDGGYETAAAMKLNLDSLKLLVSDTKMMLDRAEKGGIDAKNEKYDLHSADDAVIKARAAIHHFNLDKFMEIVQPGIETTKRIQAAGEEALHDLRMRQVGLGLSLPIIALVAILLWFKIRRIEGHGRSGT